MRYVLVALLSLMPAAHAREEVECTKKKDNLVHCDFEKAVTITRITINGGDCGDFSISQHIPAHHHWVISNTKSCHYVSSLTLQTSDGRIHRFAPL